MTFRTCLIVAVISLGAAGCAPEAPATQSAASQVESVPATMSPLAPAEKFMETWNTRDPEIWASSLNFPHARPSARGYRLWPTKEDYVAGVDYANVIATGWDHTVFEDLRLIHEGDTKTHVAGRWSRVDADDNSIRRNLVTYVATEVEGQWGIQARFGAGAPLPEDQQGPVAESAIAKVEEYLAAFNARDPAAWAATLNYPHLRVASGTVREWETEGEFAEWMDFDAFAERTGWDHSRWDQIEAVQVAENGVNVALTFSRYNADDELISTFDTLYLVTNDNGSWGIRARSSFAP